MRYLQDSFSIMPGANKAYRDNYDRIFGKEPFSLENENVLEGLKKEKEFLQDQLHDLCVREVYEPYNETLKKNKLFLQDQIENLNERIKHFESK